MSGSVGGAGGGRGRRKGRSRDRDLRRRSLLGDRLKLGPWGRLGNEFVFVNKLASIEVCNIFRKQILLNKFLQGCGGI